jgi:hypothetical protein
VFRCQQSNGLLAAGRSRDLPFFKPPSLPASWLPSFKPMTYELFAWHLKPKLYSFSTLRAVFEILIQCFSAISACPGVFMLLPGEIRSRCMCGLVTTIAYNKRLTLFDSENWNKEQAEVVVHALIIRLMQPANRTSARILI